MVREDADGGADGAPVQAKGPCTVGSGGEDSGGRYGGGTRDGSVSGVRGRGFIHWSPELPSRLVSWDVFVQDLPDGIRSVRDIPDDFSPAPLGTSEDIVERIRAAVPDIDFSDQRYPGWGIIRRADYSVEVSVGDRIPGERDRAGRAVLHGRPSHGQCGRSRRPRGPEE